MEKSDLTCVYWIRKVEHTNIYTEGYVGVSTNVERRWRELITEARANRHPNSFLCNAINEHYPDNLIFEIVYLSNEDNCYNYEEMLRPETSIGWNLRSGGPVGKMSEEGRKAISNKTLGKKLTEKEKENRRYNKYVKLNGFISKQKYKELMGISNRAVPERYRELKIFSINTAEIFTTVYEAEKSTGIKAFDIFLKCENKEEEFIWLKDL